MAIPLTCPLCGAAYRLPDNLQGKQVRCSKCQKTFMVPAAAAPAAEEPLVVTEVLDEPDEPRRGLQSRPGRVPPAARPARPRPLGPPARTPARKKSSALPVVLIVGGVLAGLCVLCSGVGGLAFLFTDRLPSTKSAVAQGRPAPFNPQPAFPDPAVGGPGG